MKKILTILALVVVAAAGFWALMGIEINTVESSMARGSVVEVGERYLVVKGHAVPKDGDEEQEMTVRFSIDSNTQFTNRKLLITKENRESTEPYTPEVIEVAGSLSELPIGMFIDFIESKGNLKEGGRAKAVKIEYSSIELVPDPSENPISPEPAI